MNSFLTPILYDIKKNLFFPLFIGVIFCFISLIFSIFVWILDKKREKSEINEEFIDKKEKKHTENAFKSYWKIVKQLNHFFWLIIFITMIIHGSYSSYDANANNLISDSFNITNLHTGYLLTIVYGIAPFFIPIIGIFIDKFGKRGYLIIASHVLFILTILLMIVLPIFMKNINNIVIIPLIFLGLFYATFSATIVSCVPLYVNLEQVTIAFGIFSSTQSITSSIFPYLFGLISDHSLNEMHGYLYPQIFLISFLLASCILLSILIILDIKKDKKLFKIIRTE